MYLVSRMSGEEILTIIPPEFMDDVELLIPTILPPEEASKYGTETED
ncbi:MAG: hypothetical protein RXN82_03215 [Caldivirga sp.]|nr:hypothetical protein [Caldivirga sp. MU80]